MKKTWIIVSLILIMVMALVGCGKKEPTPEEAAATSEAYNAIYENYADQITKEGNKYLEEYEAETADETKPVKLIKPANDKVQALAELQKAASDEMVALMTENDDDYSVYEEYFDKLYGVYKNAGLAIYSAYMDKFAELVPDVNDEMKQMMLNKFSASLNSMVPKAEEK